MNENLISSLQRFTLEARHTLEREVAEQLEGLYGWLPDGTFSLASHYPALAQLEAARDTRRRLEAYVSEEKDAGFDARAARRKLVRESSFSWLNRIVALRMMEERRLIKITVSKLSESNAYLFWLADEKDPSARKLHDQGEIPVNPMGEGPRHIAYRRFLLWQCAELAHEVSVLFDPLTLASCLFPRPSILKSLIEVMSLNDLNDAWKPGNEETIGWIYQSFHAEELQAAFTSAREHGKKFGAEDIPAVTQLFTTKWIVRFLVENTVGRFWIELHPDSRLKQNLSYLVPTTQSVQRTFKLAREITFLDPACGSMHFGLVAFDLFYEMYREELENAGKPSWPEKPSVISADDIPSSIIEHNLHGIDIDLRAVQLSVLSLFLRARTINPKCAFTDKNLTSANVEQLTGGKLEDFIRQTHFSHPVYERILRSLAIRLKDSDNLGSLLRPEEDLQLLIAEERRKALADKQFALGFGSKSPEQFETQAGLEDFFNTLQDELLHHLDAFVRQSRNSGQDPSHFAIEAAKGLRFLRLVQHRYDVVTTNPPYLSNRKMNKRLADLIGEGYPEAKNDTFAAFIVRCSELLDSKGLMGMLTMHSFMFISRYDALRAKLRRAMTIETMAHLGGGLFAVGNPGTLQTVAFVLRKEPEEIRREENVGFFFRLVRETTGASKQIAFDSAISSLRAQQPHSLVFSCHQRVFDVIPGKPWIYWTPQGLITLFSRSRFIRDIAPGGVGQNTGDNERFLRYWWEIPCKLLKRDCRSQSDAVISRLRWFPYMKGGASIPWWGNQAHIINWYNDAAEIKAYAVIRNQGRHWSRYIQNLEFCFRKGVTWSDISSTKFAARLSPGGFINDVSGMACYPEESEIALVLGLLNSRIAKFLLAALNPTIHYQVGDIARLPVPTESSHQLSTLVNDCIELTKQVSRESEMTYDFIQPLDFLEKMNIRESQLSNKETEVDDIVSNLYGLTPNDKAAIDRELSSVISKTDEESGEDTEGGDEVDTAPATISPQAWALSWLSYAVGVILGRFELAVTNGLGCGAFPSNVVTTIKGLVALDGVLVNDTGQPLALATRVWQALQSMLGFEEAKKRVNIACGNGDPLEILNNWLDRFSGTAGTSFWKYHYQLYRKRPVYWPLQSPKRQYTIWVYHEQITRDTLFHIRNDIVEPRLRLAEREIADLRTRSAGDRRARKELDQRLDFSDDLREFSKRLKVIADRGYTPHIDDGVLLNAAPLYEILPSWPETNTTWDKLDDGEYDWAQQAMAYWPERVKDKCKTNSSFAIAHGLAVPEDSTKKTDEKSVEKSRGRSKRK